ncbi:MAG: tRNA threonylcarbamoyladenosine dehydratase [Treponema sp.]|nr:tRNA threonylcarbamoyladenosine dehydratase [Treponema sp.]
MANPLFGRLTLITGPDAAGALEASRVIVVGIGGVGSWAAEALVRSGVGSVSIVDSDRVCVSNTNRQIQATGANMGRLKTEVLEERLRDINPGCQVTSFPRFFTKETADSFGIREADFIIDAIDTLQSKLDLIEVSLAAGKKLFSSMGMGKKLDPTLIRTADIWKTEGCPLARLVRNGLRKRKCFGHFTAVYSPELLPVRDNDAPAEDAAVDIAASGGARKAVFGSAVTVTATAGMVLASLVLRDVYVRYSP